MMQGKANQSVKTGWCIRQLLRTVCMLALLPLTVGASITLLHAQSAKSPTDTYHAYGKALEAAKSWDDVLPFLASGSVAQITAGPADKKRQYLAFAKIVAGDRNMPEIIKETTDGDAATVVIAYCSEDRKRGKATVSLLREMGAWKFQKDQSDVGLEAC